MPRGKFESHVLPYLDKIKDWTEKGCTDMAIAENLHVGYSSYRRYKALGERGDRKYAGFSSALAEAKPVPDDEVENSLHRRCTGYNATIAKTFKLKETEYDPDTGRKVAEREKLCVGYDEIHVTPDINAQMFWLTNRRPERWRRDGHKSGGEDAISGGVIIIPAAEAEEDEE